LLTPPKNSFNPIFVTFGSKKFVLSESISKI
jgi:hypothetical protein